MIKFNILCKIVVKQGDVKYSVIYMSSVAERSANKWIFRIDFINIFNLIDEKCGS